MKTSEFITKAGDGCHRYGWLINIVFMILMFAYFMGGINTSLNDLKERVSRLEERVDNIRVKLP